MKKLTDWIRHHNIAAFFTITFAITWGLGSTFNAAMNQGQFLLAPLFFIALCGPSFMQLLNLVSYIAVIGIIVMDRMWRKLPLSDPAVYPTHKVAVQPGVEPTAISGDENKGGHVKWQ